MKCILLRFCFFYCCLVSTAQAQNVGIGTNTPQAPLHIAAASGNPLRIEGGGNMYMSWFENGTYRGYLGSFAGNAEDVDFGTGSGNTAGKLHLTIQATPKLTIRENGFVGINTTSPLYLLDVNGNTRLGGQLFAGGTAGASGQVLTSNGAGAPAWQTLNTAFENDTRFGVSFARDGSTTGAMNSSTTYYNLNTTNITINATSILINKTGLYHLDGNFSGYLIGTFPFLPEMNCYMSVTPPVANFFSYEFLAYKAMPLRSGFTSSYGLLDQFSVDMHLTAGTLLRFNMEFNAGIVATNTQRDLKVFGYLVSE